MCEGIELLSLVRFSCKLEHRSGKKNRKKYVIEMFGVDEVTPEVKKSCLFEDPNKDLFNLPLLLIRR